MLETRLRTERILLRPWRDDDLEPFAALNADPDVMEWFPSTLSRQESDDAVNRYRDHARQYGYAMQPVEVPGVSPFIGLVGLQHVRFQASFTPAVEVGWRLNREHWGQGYASEAARAWLRYGFEQLGLEEIVSFTAVGNVRSRAVMERVGMTRTGAEGFDHPFVPIGHPLRRHVLYRIRPTQLK